MKRVGPALLFGIGLVGSTVAQTPVPHRATDGEFSRFTHELFLRQFEAQHAQIQAEIAKRRDAEYRERQFIEKVNKFVGIWTRFVSVYNDRKSFDLKTAKELSRAFHELESSGSWPRIGR